MADGQRPIRVKDQTKKYVQAAKKYLIIVKKWPAEVSGSKENITPTAAKYHKIAKAIT